MKKVAFVSDVHANLEALQAVLAKLVDMSIYCLGDIVGYGASPNEVIALLRSRGVTSVLGNHDYAVITGNTSDFNARAAIASFKWCGFDAPTIGAVTPGCSSSHASAT